MKIVIVTAYFFHDVSLMGVNEWLGNYRFLLSLPLEYHCIVNLCTYIVNGFLVWLFMNTLALWQYDSDRYG